jgi:hypothetical protein
MLRAGSERSRRDTGFIEINPPDAWRIKKYSACSPATASGFAETSLIADRGWPLALIGFVFREPADAYIFIYLCIVRAYIHLAFSEIGFVLRKKCAGVPGAIYDLLLSIDD